MTASRRRSYTRPEPSIPEPLTAWRDVVETIWHIAKSTLYACAIPIVVVILLLLFAGGCEFVTEGSGPHEDGTGDFETVPGPSGCAVAGCSTPSPQRVPGGAGGMEGGSASVGGEDTSEGSSGELGESSEGSTGEADPSMYGPCDALCEHAPIDFFDGCLCTEMCISDEDCPGFGVCNTEFYFCTELCSVDEDCDDGAICQIHDGLELEFCVWP